MQVTGNSKLSIQFSLDGYLYRIYDGQSLVSKSDWIEAGNVNSQPEFEYSYDEVEISILTPKVSIFPKSFFNKDGARELLGEVVHLADDEEVTYVEDDGLEVVTVFSSKVENLDLLTLINMLSEKASKSFSFTTELYCLLKEIENLKDNNKLIASYKDGYLYLVIAEGETLRLANSFKANDFTTAVYFLFNALKKFQINPEISTIYFRTPLDEGQSITLYRYFKAVEQL